MQAAAEAQDKIVLRPQAGEGWLDALIAAARQARDDTFVYFAVVHTPGGCSTHTLVVRKGGRVDGDMYDKLRELVLHEFCASHWEFSGELSNQHASVAEALKHMPAADAFELFFEKSDDAYCDMHSFPLSAMGYGPLASVDYVSRMPDTPAANEVMTRSFWPMLAQLLAQPESTPEYVIGQSVLTDLVEACRPG